MMYYIDEDAINIGIWLYIYKEGFFMGDWKA